MGATVSNFLEDIQYSRTKITSIVTGSIGNGIKRKIEQYFLHHFNKHLSLGDRKFLKKDFEIISLSASSSLLIFPGVYWVIIDNSFIKSIDKLISGFESQDFELDNFGKIFLAKLDIFSCFENSSLLTKKPELISKYPFSETTLAYVCLTNRCNLNCPYCVARANDVNIDISEETIHNVQSIIDNLESFVSTRLNNLNSIKINITGGEPFLFRNIKQVLPLLKNKGNIYYSITTNGLLLTDELLQEVKKNSIDLIFSIDSHEYKGHDKFRGEGNFNKTIINIRKAVDLGINVFVNSFLYNDNYTTLSERTEFFKEIGVCGINFINSFGRGRDDSFFFQPIQERIMLRSLYEIINKNPSNVTLFESISMFSSLFSRVLLGAKMTHSGTGYNEPIMVNYNKDVYVSPSLFLNKNYLYGKVNNIREQSFWDKNINIKNIRLWNIDSHNSGLKKDIFKYFHGGENLGEDLVYKGNSIENPFFKNRQDSLIEVFKILSENPNFFEEQKLGYLYGIIKENPNLFSYS
ncbi:MAG: radical SAM protein [Candidatus Gracilibacteria bacterium]